MITTFIALMIALKILENVSADTIMLVVVIGVASDMNFLSNVLKK